MNNTLAEIKLKNARAELEMAILSGNSEREMCVRRLVVEMEAQVEAEHVPIDKPEVYSVHTVVIDA